VHLCVASTLARLTDTALSVAAVFVLFATTANESNKLGFDAATGKILAGGGEKIGGGRKMPNSERGQFYFDIFALISCWYILRWWS
jgi:hypothetical protein